jgi:hypothetical protein
MIKLNNLQIMREPVGYDDNPEMIKTDSFSINGTLERQRYPDKQRVKMSYDVATPELVRYFKQLEAAGVVNFKNDASVYGGLDFDGVLTVETAEYARGGSLLVGLNVTIREV